MSNIHTVLIANRGEIACRIIETVHQLGLRSVAVYSDADATARHVGMADVAVRLGAAPASESYLNIAAIIGAATATGANAIHPGYGFLSENEDLATACAAAGITFVGPGAEALRIMGDKITSKNHVKASGVPVIPGIDEPGLTDAELISKAGSVGYPMIIKPSAGGGGKGMHVVHAEAELAEGIAQARRVAKAAFGDDTLFIERLVTTPRHIEVQILADTHGNVVHLFERECSLQRRHQKVVEEAPSVLLDAATRERIGAAACDVARSVNYCGAGTVEFLVSDDAPGEFFFMEMNTRLQVEHPVTEEITGLDLVAWQLAIAGGASLDTLVRPEAPQGHSVEVRIYAESPWRGFLPTTGSVIAYREPVGAHVRVDSMLRTGLEISTHYDPMLAKIIATGPDRTTALATLRRALAETVILGVETNLEYLQVLLADVGVVAGRLDTGLIDRKFTDLSQPELEPKHWIAAALAQAEETTTTTALSEAWGTPDGYRLGAPAPKSFTVTHNETTRCIKVYPKGHVTLHDPQTPTETLWEGHAELNRVAGRTLLTLGAETHHITTATSGETLWLHLDGRTFECQMPTRASALKTHLASLERGGATGAPEVTASMPGTVVMIGAATGDAVAAGDALVTIEAMKMEHKLTATISGTAEILVAVGDQVKLGQTVAIVTPNAE